MPKRTDISSILIIGAGPIIIGPRCKFDYSGTQAVTPPKGLSVRFQALQSLSRFCWQASCPGYVQLRRSERRQSPDFGPRVREKPALRHIAGRHPRRNRLSGPGGHQSTHHNQQEMPACVCRLAENVLQTATLQSLSSRARAAMHCLLPILLQQGLESTASIRSRHSYRPKSFFAQIGNSGAATRRDRQIDTRPAHLEKHLANRFTRRANNADMRFQRAAHLFFHRMAMACSQFAQSLLNIIVEFSNRQTGHSYSPVIALQSLYAMKAQ